MLGSRPITVLTSIHCNHTYIHHHHHTPTTTTHTSTHHHRPYIHPPPPTQYKQNIHLYNAYSKISLLYLCMVEKSPSLFSPCHKTTPRRVCFIKRYFRRNKKRVVQKKKEHWNGKSVWRMEQKPLEWNNLLYGRTIWEMEQERHNKLQDGPTTCRKQQPPVERYNTLQNATKTRTEHRLTERNTSFYRTEHRLTERNTSLQNEVPAFKKT